MTEEFASEPTGIRPYRVTWSSPEFRVGAAAPVYRDGKYCGNLTRERSVQGIGWTFHAVGPYGNVDLVGFRSIGDAACWLASHDDLGFPISPAPSVP
jgi:hypothetical protein